MSASASAQPKKRSRIDTEQEQQVSLDKEPPQVDNQREKYDDNFVLALYGKKMFELHDSRRAAFAVISHCLQTGCVCFIVFVC